MKELLPKKNTPHIYMILHFSSEVFLWLLRQVKVHLVVDDLALWVEPLQNLGQHVDRLLAAQPRALRLELLQEVFRGHRFPDQVSADCVLRQLHVTVAQRKADVFISPVSVSNI